MLRSAVFSMLLEDPAFRVMESRQGEKVVDRAMLLIAAGDSPAKAVETIRSLIAKEAQTA